MDIFAKSGMIDNARKDKEIKTEQGFLLGVVNDSAIEMPFKYAVLSSARFDTAFSAFPTEYTRPSLSISTYRVELPFVNNGRIRTSANTIMTIKDIRKITHPQSGKLQKFEIELIGGVGA